MGSFGGLVRLGLLSGLRRNEIAELEWSDIRDDAIVIPASRSKMGREHFVPLTSAMKTVLSAQPKTSNPLVFPSPVSNGVMNGWSKLLPRLANASGVGFRTHDTRRTCRTLMSRLGIEEAVAELAIGHVRRGLVGIYNKDVQWPARISAFEKVSVARLGSRRRQRRHGHGSETPVDHRGEAPVVTQSRLKHWLQGDKAKPLDSSIVRWPSSNTQTEIRRRFYTTLRPKCSREATARTWRRRPRISYAKGSSVGSLASGATVPRLKAVKHVAGIPKVTRKMSDRRHGACGTWPDVFRVMTGWVVMTKNRNQG